MTDKEAMKLALFALDIVKIHYTQSRHINEAIAALKERLAQPEQEPVAVYGYCPECGEKGVMRERRPDGNDKCAKGHTYPSSKATTAPQRTWVGLKDSDFSGKPNTPDFIAGAFFAEAKLKQKNGYAEEKNAICSPFMISELWKLHK